MLPSSHSSVRGDQKRAVWLVNKAILQARGDELNVSLVNTQIMQMEELLHEQHRAMIKPS